MRVYCRCGNMLTNQLDPNDTEYYVYSDREWYISRKNECNPKHLWKISS